MLLLFLKKVTFISRAAELFHLALLFYRFHSDKTTPKKDYFQKLHNVFNFTSQANIEDI